MPVAELQPQKPFRRVQSTDPDATHRPDAQFAPWPGGLPQIGCLAPRDEGPGWDASAIGGASWLIKTHRDKAPPCRLRSPAQCRPGCRAQRPMGWRCRPGQRWATRRRPAPCGLAEPERPKPEAKPRSRGAVPWPALKPRSRVLQRPQVPPAPGLMAPNGHPEASSKDGLLRRLDRGCRPNRDVSRHYDWLRWRCCRISSPKPSPVRPEAGPQMLGRLAPAFGPLTQAAAYEKSPAEGRALRWNVSGSLSSFRPWKSVPHSSHFEPYGMPFGVDRGRRPAMQLAPDPWPGSLAEGNDLQGDRASRFRQRRRRLCAAVAIARQGPGPVAAGPSGQHGRRGWGDQRRRRWIQL